uniref:Uncharacterized protein n=1 Tax=Micrurus spixii TaxID=129469 RepID=A0A2D4NAI6_9SAUR
MMNCLVLTTLILPIWSGRKGIMQTPLTKEFWLVGSRRRAFSAIDTIPWNILSLEVRLASILLTFWNSVKTWFSQLVGDPRVMNSHRGGWFLLEALSDFPYCFYGLFYYTSPRGTDTVRWVVYKLGQLINKYVSVVL